MSMFLTSEDLHELTGYKQPSRQIEMLKRQKIRFHVNAAGHPKVARATLEGGKAAPPPVKTWEPSW